MFYRKWCVVINMPLKPWEYESYDEKLYSLYQEYINDENVLKKVLKKEDDMLVKAHASHLLFALNNLPPDGDVMYEFLRDNVGLSEVDATALMFAGAENIELMESEKRRYYNAPKRSEAEVYSYASSKTKIKMIIRSILPWIIIIFVMFMIFAFGVSRGLQGL